VNNQEYEINAQEEIEESENDNGREIIVRRTAITPQQSTRLQDYIIYKVSKVMYQIQDFISYKNIFFSTHGFYNFYIKGARTK
jgi:hypothetical protein